MKEKIKKNDKKRSAISGMKYDRFGVIMFS